jgi:hypothetical protein
VPLAVEQTPDSLLRIGSGRRRPELDALRGLFLVWMTLTHLPTPLSAYVNQPFGFVSSAEGFVFLSSMLVARLYIQQRDSENTLRGKLWRRSLRIYGYHLFMLTFAFTIAAGIAEHTHRPALVNLLGFYLAHPVTAIIGSVLLIYCPPLLDILPMYILFMLATPPILTLVARRRWPLVLTTSSLVWLLAQFGLRNWIHALVVQTTHLQIPLEQTGAFNLFAWQLIWILGLWIGSTVAAGDLPFRRLPRATYPICFSVCLFFFAIRHHWFGLNQQHFGLLLDKWQIGPLRLVNFIAIVCVAYGARRVIERIVLVEPFLTLGRASLEVFCAHVFFVFGGLALLYGQVDQLHGYHAVLLVLVTLTGMLLVAIREANRQRPRKSPQSHAPTIPF